MQSIELTVRFVSPAFLGNADQRGEWRVPPFKAQLRYWWRFVYAAEKGLDIQDMRKAEGELFGSASGEQGHASKVRMRLDRWRLGHMSSLEKPAIERWVYLGYGPVTNEGLKKLPAIDADEQAKLKIGFQTGNGGLSGDKIEQIKKALCLMHRFGQIGGRSRNGWGSYVLEGDLPSFDLEPFTRDWREALNHQWPHAIGSDDHPLIWRTEAKKSWREVLDLLTTLRQDLNRIAKDLRLRHIMNFPAKGASNPRVSRIPNSLRFKIVQDENEKFYGRIFYTPCKPATVSLERAVSLWQEVHQNLDKDYQRERV